MKLGMTVTGRFGTRDLSVPFHHGLFSLHCSFGGYVPTFPDIVALHHTLSVDIVAGSLYDILLVVHVFAGIYVWYSRHIENEQVMFPLPF